MKKISLADFDIDSFLDDLHSATDKWKYSLDTLMGLELDNATRKGGSHFGYICPFCGGGSGPHGTGLEPMKNEVGYFIHSGCKSGNHRRDIIDIELGNRGLNDPKLATPKEWIESAHDVAIKVGVDPVKYGLVIDGDNLENTLKVVEEYRKRPPKKPEKTPKEKIEDIIKNKQEWLDIVRKAVIEDDLDGLLDPNNELVKNGRIYDRRSIIKENQENFTRDCLGAQILLEKYGISYETAKKMGVGFSKNPIDRIEPDLFTGELKRVSAYQLENEPCLFYPGYEIAGAYRSLDENSKTKKANFKGIMVPYNIIETMKSGYDGPIFIVEGFTDMLAIMQAGGHAIAINGVNSQLIIATIAEFKKDGYWNNDFICLLDRDQAGSTNNQKLCDNLKLIDGLEDRVFIPTDFYPTLDDLTKAEIDRIEDQYRKTNRDKFLEDGKFNIEKFLSNIDPNEAWVNFSKRTTNVVTEWTKDPSKHAKELLELEVKALSSNSTMDVFLDRIAGEDANIPISTGFKWLDSPSYLNGGLREGLYILGAESGVGKTSLALQIADQVAVNGEDVLYFSLEMSKYELIAKSLSRYTAFFEGMDNQAFSKNAIENGYQFENALTLTQILTQNKLSRITDKQLDLLSRSLEAYRSNIGDHIYIVEGVSSLGVEDIKDYVDKHVRATGRKPLVIIDYVQIIAPDNPQKSDKQVLDNNIVALKRLSRDYSIPVFTISSFNRSSYGGTVYDVDTLLSAFKESGALEYTADVAMVLLNSEKVSVKNAIGGKQAKQNKIQNNKEIDLKELNTGIRYVQLIILKNRNGEKGRHLYFTYLPTYHLFLQRRKFDGNQGYQDSAMGEYHRMEYPALTKDHQYLSKNDIEIDYKRLAHIRSTLSLVYSE